MITLFLVPVEGQLGVEGPSALWAGVREYAREVLWLNVHPDVGDGLVPVDGAEVAADRICLAAQVFVQVGQTTHLSTIRKTTYKFKTYYKNTSKV